MTSGSRWHIKATVGNFYPLGLELCQALQFCACILQPRPLRDAGQPISFADLQPIHSIFPSTSPLAAGQQHPATAHISLVAAFSEFSLLLFASNPEMVKALLRYWTAWWRWRSVVKSEGSSWCPWRWRTGQLAEFSEAWLPDPPKSR